MYCPRCGASNAADAQFCVSCGNGLPTPASPFPPQPPPRPAPGAWPSAPPAGGAPPGTPPQPGGAWTMPTGGAPKKGSPVLLIGCLGCGGLIALVVILGIIGAF